MRWQTLTKTLTAAVVNNVALTQALAAAGALTLNGAAVTAGIAQLDSQRRISILSSGNDSGLVWTVSGTMQSGATISENVTGGNAVAVMTLQDFYTVTSVVGSGATAGTVQVGTNSTGSSAWIPVDAFMGPEQFGFNVQLLSGGATATIETAADSPFPPLPIYMPGYSQTQPIPLPFPLPGITAVVGNAQTGLALTGIAAWRLTLGGAAGSFSAVCLQTGIIN